MKNIFAVILLVCVLAFHSSGQEFQKQFDALVAQKDTLGQKELLKRWEAEQKNDPELYVAYFNFYVSASRKDMIELGNHPKGTHVISIMDKDTAKKEPVAYMYGNTYYDYATLKKGFQYADRGLALFPARLDIRFGKVYMFGQLENWNAFTTEILHAVEYSHKIHNAWTWSGNKPVDDPKQFFLQTIQSYQNQLYRTNNDTLLENINRIAEKILHYYPDQVECLSDLSVVYLLRKQYDKALAPLLKAETLAPTDYIVLGNIAQAYKMKGDTKNAIAYYQKVVKYGDKREQEYAKKQLQELQRP